MALLGLSAADHEMSALGPKAVMQEIPGLPRENIRSAAYCASACTGLQPGTLICLIWISARSLSRETISLELPENVCLANLDSQPVYPRDCPV
jgi:hypothetical protein